MEFAAGYKSSRHAYLGKHVSLLPNPLCARTTISPKRSSWCLSAPGFGVDLSSVPMNCKISFKREAMAPIRAVGSHLEDTKTNTMHNVTNEDILLEVHCVCVIDHGKLFCIYISKKETSVDLSLKLNCINQNGFKIDHDDTIKSRYCQLIHLSRVLPA